MTPQGWANGLTGAVPRTMTAEPEAPRRPGRAFGRQQDARAPRTRERRRADGGGPISASWRKGRPSGQARFCGCEILGGGFDGATPRAEGCADKGLPAYRGWTGVVFRVLPQGVWCRVPSERSRVETEFVYR